MADIKNHSTLPTSLVSYWEMEEVSGIRYDSVTGTGNDLADATTVPSKTGLYGLGLDLSSGTDYVSITDTNQTGLDNITDMSISAWFKVDASGVYHSIVSKMGSGASNTSYLIRVANDNSQIYVLVSDGTDYSDGNVASSAITIGVWYHIIMVYNGTTGTIDVTLNGVDKTQITGASRGVNDTPSAITFIIGATYGSGAPYWITDGTIDEVGFWDKQLSAGEKISLYNGGAGIPYEQPADVKNDTDLSTSLVSYWEMEETSGTRYDSHGSNDLTDSTAILSASGAHGEGANFEEVNDDYLYKNDPGSWDLDIAGDMSFAGWFKLGTAITGQHYFLMRDSGDPNRNWAFGFLESSGDNLCMYNSSDGTNGNTTGLRCVTTGTLSTGTWYHLAYTYDASAGQGEVYVDGVSKGTVTGLKTSMYTGGTARLVLGQYSPNPATGIGYDGVIDELGIWTKVLTASEITNLYNGGAGIPYEQPADVVNDTDLTTSLISYWELEETSGNDRVDSHGSNDLTDSTTVAQGAGIQGYGADFTASNNEYLNITDGDGTDLDFNGWADFTISMWVKAETLTASWMDLFGTWNSSGSQAILNNDKITFYVWNGSTHSNWQGSITGGMSAGNWYHIVLAFDGSAQKCRVWVNGTDDGRGWTSSTYSTFPTTTTDANADFCIGAGRTASTTTFDGIIDEFSLWKEKILTEKEIDYLYNGGLGIPYGTPAASTTNSNFLAFMI